MFKKKTVSDKQILIVVRLIDASKKFLIFLVLFGQLVSLIPQNAFHANAASDTSENDIAIEESTEYQSDELDISLVPITHEDESRRTANEKHFRKLDGTYEVAIYDNEVHYYEDGKWKDIDNSLNDNGNYLENKNNNIKTTFPKTLDENKTIGIKSNDYSIDWKVLDISRSSSEYINTEKKQSLSTELASINQSVIYKNVRNQVDLKYILQGPDVKEYIILNEYSEEFSMSFEYTLKNLKLVETDEGIIFFNQANESVFKFDDLFMVDSNNNLSHDVEYEITETKNDTYNIAILPNDEWLSKASYPVMIDPTIISTTTTMSITDTYILDSTPSANYDSSYYMFLGNTALSERYKGLLDFEIPSEIMNQVITYAHLSFSFVYGCPDSESQCSTPNTQLNIYKNTESFDSSTATWYNAPDYDDKVLDYHIVNLNSPFVFDVTKPVKEWQNLGIVDVPGFTIADENEYGALNIVYQNNVSHLVLRPVIKIGYEEPSGLKDYWTYTSQNTGMVGTGYISDYTGNLTWVRNEYELKNELLSLSLSFFHNNYSRSVDIGYGDGWRTNYSIQIKYDSPTGLYYMHKPDGNKIFFMNNECSLVFSDVESCKSIAEDGSRMSLERMTYFGQNESMKITTVSNIEYNFNGAGRLSSIRNIKNNQSLWVYYIDTTSLKISYVKDSADNRISLYYNGSRLTQSTLDLKQTDGSLRQVERRDYFYDTYNNIDYIDYDFRYGNGSNTGWTTDANNRFQFNFDADNKLLDAYNQKDNFKVQYGYDTNDRVNVISTTDDTLKLGLTSIIYGNSKTTYTSYEGDSIYYTFDHYGHTINVIDDHANSIYYRYSGLFTYSSDLNDQTNGFEISNIYPNYKNNHKLISSSDVIKQHQNPITNHGFEEGNIGWTLVSGSDAIFSYSQTESVLGDKSLRLTKNSTNAYVYQSVYLGAGEYTITGWIKHSGGTPGAFIDVSNVSTKGIIEKVSNKSGWEFYQLTFSITTNRTVEIRLTNETQSTAYFDNVQILDGFTDDEVIDGYIDTRYNAVTNNSFEGNTTGWTLSGASRVALYETGVMDDILGEYGIQIDGNGSTFKYFKQDATNLVSVRGTYMVGGWAKAGAVPNKAYYDGQIDSDDRFFGISVLVCSADPEYPTGPSICETWYLPFNSSNDEWQFQMLSFDIPDFVTLVEINGIYRGEGTAYFDNIQLYHDDISTKYSYDSITGDLDSVTKPDGTETTYGYDANGNITSIVQGDQTIEFERNSTYQIEEVFSSNNVRTIFVYDSVTKQLRETIVGYDETVAPEDNHWFKTSTAYTNDGQYVNSVTDEFGNTTAATIDKTIGTVTQMVDAIGNIQNLYYDEYGNLKDTYIFDMTTGASSAPYLYGNYTYDSQGRLWKISRSGYVYEFVYNNLNQITSVKIANVTVMSYEYWMDESGEYHTGLLKKQSYANLDTVEFTYTKEKQIKAISFNGNDRYEYTYDSMGKLSIYKDIHNNNIYFYSYDLAGRLNNVTDKDGNEITYKYDKNGNVDYYQYDISGISRGVTYRYDDITGEYEYTLYNVSGTTIKKDFNYDSDSLRRLNSIDLVIGTNTFKKIFGYDDAKVDSSMGNATNRIYQITYQKNTTTQYIHQYTYDENHNITQISIGVPGVPIETYDYFYDGFNQLIREDIWISGSLSKTMTYSYDSQNNITSIKTFARGITTGTPQNEKRMFYQNTWKDQLTKIEYYVSGSLSYSQTFVYDASGNVTHLIDSRTSYANKSYQWDGRQLSNYSAYCNSLSFKYNDQGMRTQKFQGSCSGSVTTNYTLDGDKVLVESRSNGIKLYFTYDVDGTLLSMNYNGNEYFYITNLQGDIIELVDINGNSVVKYNYDAWGNIIYKSGGALADINPYLYRGYRYDIETGLYYLQSRYYDPAIGRFISSDGLLGETGNPIGHNTYAYCANNPVMYSDITGEFPVLISLLAVVAYAVWTVVDLCKVYNGELSFDEETGNLNNSNKVQNPSVIFGYSLYMKYVSDYKDYFEGSAGGIAAEWIWHNTLFDGSIALNILGIDSVFGVSVSDIYSSAETAGFGSSVFRDTIDNQSRPEVVYPSLVIEGLISPVSLVYDFYKEYLRRD